MYLLLPIPCVIGLITSISKKFAGAAYASSSVCFLLDSRLVASSLAILGKSWLRNGTKDTLMNWSTVITCLRYHIKCSVTSKCTFFQRLQSSADVTKIFICDGSKSSRNIYESILFMQNLQNQLMFTGNLVSDFSNAVINFQNLSLLSLIL